MTDNGKDVNMLKIDFWIKGYSQAIAGVDLSLWGYIINLVTWLSLDSTAYILCAGDHWTVLHTSRGLSGECHKNLMAWLLWWMADKAINA